MSKVLILGSTGYLGSHILKKLRNTNLTLISHGRKKEEDLDVCFDLSSRNNLIKNFIEISPDIVINLTALTNVDTCEKNYSLAEQINSINCLNIVKAINALQKKCYLIHLSTDQVYSGSGPHIEKYAKPINNYGTTKLKGEMHIAEHKDSIILRTNFLGSCKNKKKMTLSDWIISSLKNKMNITVFKNVFFNPVYIDTLCDEITSLIDMQHKGIYNLGSIGKISKAEFALFLCRQLNLDESLLSFSKVEHSNLIAQRPNDMTMSIQKYAKHIKSNLPKLEDEIEKLVDFYKRYE